MSIDNFRVMYHAKWKLHFVESGDIRWKILEMPGIDPGTSHMLSERSTIWATSPWNMVKLTTIWYELSWR